MLKKPRKNFGIWANNFLGALFTNVKWQLHIFEISIKDFLIPHNRSTGTNYAKKFFPSLKRSDFFYKQILDFDCPFKFLCKTSRPGRQNHSPLRAFSNGTPGTIPLPNVLRHFTLANRYRNPNRGRILGKQNVTSPEDGLYLCSRQGPHQRADGGSQGQNSCNITYTQQGHLKQV